MPDQPVIWGISRSLADSPAPALSCGYAAHGGPANVLLSSRTRVRVAVGAQVRRGVAPRRVSLGAKLGAKVLRSRHVRDECSAPWARCGRDLLGRREEPVHGFGLARVRPRREADPAESLLKLTPRRRSVPTIWIRSARDREVSRWGAVTPGTVEETTAPTGLIDTPALQHVFNAFRTVIGVPGGQKLIMSLIVRFSADSGQATASE